ncbi:MAG: hypothetical protein AAFR91_12910, partial [Pseudomonadota bacterium]
MSKIQNALKRIRQSKGESGSKTVQATVAKTEHPKTEHPLSSRSSTDETIATLALREETIAETGEFRTKRVIEVNRAKLREAGM